MIVSNNINMTTAGVLTRVQVFKHVTRDRVLDISEMLSLEPKRSKIAFTLVEFDESHKATVRVKHYADATDFKLVCWDILYGNFEEWTDYKGTVYDDGIQARTLALRKDTKYRQPFEPLLSSGAGRGQSPSTQGALRRPHDGDFRTAPRWPRAPLRLHVDACRKPGWWHGPPL